MSTPPSATEPAKSTEVCAFCKTETRGYYRVGSTIGCVPCTEKLRETLRTNPSRYYGMALGAGVAASIVCSLIYGIVLIGTGISFGTIFIGIVVASVMMWASKGTGGLRYRLTAVLLTYIAGTVPWGFFLYDKGVALWMVVVAGLISPIYRIQGSGGAMESLVFLGIGLFIAWKIAGGTPPPGIYGPFDAGGGTRL